MLVRDFLGIIRFGFVDFEKWFANHEARALISELAIKIVLFHEKETLVAFTETFM